MDGHDVKLRIMRAADIPAAHAISIALRWPHRLQDWEFAFSIGKGVVAEKWGEVVATALSWQWGSSYSTLGLVVVDPKSSFEDGRVHVARAALDLLDDRAVLLCARDQEASPFERLGFVPYGRVHQFEGEARLSRESKPPNGSVIRPVEPEDESVLVALDSQARGMNRAALIGELLACSQSVALEISGTVRGFAMARPFGIGLVVGPVVAPNALAARDLICNLIAKNAGRHLRIDVPSESGLSQALAAFGLKQVSESRVMVRGNVPVSSAWMRSFALASQSLG